MADVGFYTQAQPNALLDTAQQAVGIRNAQLANAQAHQDLVRQQVGTLVDAFSSLATNPNVSRADFERVGSTLLQQGVIDPNTYKQEMATLPATGTPQQYQQIANGYLSRALDAGSRFGVEYGYGPGQGASTVPITEPNGAVTTMTQSAAAGRLGYQSPMGAPTSGTASVPSNPFTAAPTSSAAAPNALTGGAHPAAVADRAAELRAATGAPAEAPMPLAQPIVQPGGVTAPSPQQAAQFQASAAQQQAEKTADAGFVGNMVPLKKSIALLKEVPLFGTGAAIPDEVIKTLATFGVPAAALQAKDSSELEKYLVGIARNSGAADTSVAQLEASLSGNPNMGSDRFAARDVLSIQAALQRLQHLKVATFGDAPGEQYSDLARKWSADQDPRALAFDFMDDAAKAALRKDLEQNPAQAKRFVATYKAAQAAGIFDQ